METTTAALSPAAVKRSRADEGMRRILFVPPDGHASAWGAEGLFRKSIAISAVRCLITYILLPVLAPLVDLTTGVGPVAGLIIGGVSAAAIVVSMRRFFAADHRYRWPYAIVGGGILLLLVVQAAVDVVALL